MVAALGRMIGAGTLLLFPAQEIPTQFGGEPCILVSAMNRPVIGGTSRRGTRGFRAPVGHRKGLRHSWSWAPAEIGRSSAGVKAGTP
jgi:hypothetical protein